MIDVKFCRFALMILSWKT